MAAVGLRALSAMTYYQHPLRYTIGPKPITIDSVKHGVTEARLSDGRLVRLSLHLDGVTNDAQNNLDIACSVIQEVMDAPDVPILDVHESVQ